MKKSAGVVGGPLLVGDLGPDLPLLNPAMLRSGAGQKVE